MDVEIKVKQTVQPKLLKVYMKVRDEFCADLVDASGLVLREQEDGYAPAFMPRGGDYLALDIDIETGVVVNWVKPTPNQLAAWINGDDDE